MARICEKVCHELSDHKDVRPFASTPRLRHLVPPYIVVVAAAVAIVLGCDVVAAADGHLRSADILDLREWVRPKQLGSNLLRPDSTFGQPAAKIGDQADLDFSRIPGVAQ